MYTYKQGNMNNTGQQIAYYPLPVIYKGIYKLTLYSKCYEKSEKQIVN